MQNRTILIAAAMTVTLVNGIPQGYGKRRPVEPAGAPTDFFLIANVTQFVDFTV